MDLYSRHVLHVTLNSSQVMSIWFNTSMLVSISFHGFGNFPCIILLSKFSKFRFHDEFLIYIANKFQSCYWVSHPSSYLLLFVNLGNGLLGIPLRVFHDCINWCGKIHLSCGWAQVPGWSRGLTKKEACGAHLLSAFWSMASAVSKFWCLDWSMKMYCFLN